MRDYAKLVQSVHCCAENQCEIFPRGDTPVGCIECKTKLADDTTDAIEALQAQIPAWISVEERLPEKDEMVIVYYSWTGQSGTEYKEVSLATLDEMRYCGSQLLRWMPLPAPPKEVQKDELA